MVRKRRTVELIGLNNGQTCCSATKESNNWICRVDDETIAVGTMREAEAILREEGLATKIVRCPELPSCLQPLS